VNELIFAKIPVPYDCAEIIGKLSPIWSQSRRTAFGPQFLSAGLPIYQCEGALTEYYRLAIQGNRVLFDQLPALYTSLISTITGIFGIESYFHPTLSLPGFHFFTGAIIDSGCWHFDLQFRKAFPGLNLDVRHDVFSFTVLLSGDSHPYNDIEFGMLEFTSLNRQVSNCDHSTLDIQPKFQMKYRRNCIFIHSGLQAHRIIGASRFSDDYPRLSMQGFGARVNGKIVLYW
jgi:hypothetical protein